MKYLLAIMVMVGTVDAKGFPYHYLISASHSNGFFRECHDAYRKIETLYDIKSLDDSLNAWHPEFKHIFVVGVIPVSACDTVRSK